MLYIYSHLKSLKSNVYFTLRAHLNLAQFSTGKVKSNLTKTVKWQLMEKYLSFIFTIETYINED